MIGLQRGAVVLCSAHSEWAQEYLDAVGKLTPLVGHKAAIEHVGSTAVPELAAKPIVDIVVGWFRDEDVDYLINRIREVHYRYRGFRHDAGGHIAEYEVAGVTRRHVHLVAFESKEWRQYVSFRDYLRTCTDARREYEALKTALASRFPADRRAYTEAKRAYFERFALLQHS